MEAGYGLEQLLNYFTSMDIDTVQAKLQNPALSGEVLKILRVYLTDEEARLLDVDRRNLDRSAEVERHIPKIPRNMSDRDVREEYQWNLFNFMRMDMPHDTAVRIANELQAKTRYILFDPDMRKASRHERIVYGDGDLLRFVGMSKYLNRLNARFSPSNPLYVPVDYDVPDYSLNMLIRESDDQRRRRKMLKASKTELARLAQEYARTADAGTKVSMRVVEWTVNLLRKVMNYKNWAMNPSSWVRDPRPMERYIRDNLASLELVRRGVVEFVDPSIRGRGYGGACPRDGERVPDYAETDSYEDDYESVSEDEQSELDRLSELASREDTSGLSTDDPYVHEAYALLKAYVDSDNWLDEDHTSISLEIADAFDGVPLGMDRGVLEAASDMYAANVGSYLVRDEVSNAFDAVSEFVG